jgi:hypothetical protein
LAHALLSKRPSLVSAGGSTKRLGVVFLSGIVWAACYTGPINMRPSITIKAPGRFFRNTPVTFQTIATDPENQLLRVVWTTKPGECPDPDSARRTPADWPAVDWMGLPVVVDKPVTDSRFCVWAKAEDRYGAQAVDLVEGVPENRPPVPMLEQLEPDPAGKISFPLSTLFKFSTAKATDPDGDVPMTLGWEPKDGVKVQACPGVEASDTRFFCFRPGTVGPLVVKARVSDGIAETVAQMPLLIDAGGPPEADVRLVLPLEQTSYPLGTSFHVSGARSFDPDGDTLTPMWDDGAFRAGAPTSGESLHDCAGNPSKFERCFTADAPGLYRATLQVSDGLNRSAPKTLQLLVRDDEPPCLEKTTPPLDQPVVGAVLTAERLLPFSVDVVKDDLDPFPANDNGDRTTFRWLVHDHTDAQDAFHRVSENFPSVKVFTNTYSVGQEILVRVEILDRNVLRSSGALTTCSGNTCSSSQGCLSRTTWRVRFISVEGP